MRLEHLSRIEGGGGRGGERRGLSYNYRSICSDGNQTMDFFYFRKVKSFCWVSEHDKAASLALVNYVCGVLILLILKRPESPHPPLPPKRFILFVPCNKRNVIYLYNTHCPESRGRKMRRKEKKIFHPLIAALTRAKWEKNLEEPR